MTEHFIVGLRRLLRILVLYNFKSVIGAIVRRQDKDILRFYFYIL